nr:hypothetical protein [Tanacetum cinerariifolium]
MAPNVEVKLHGLLELDKSDPVLLWNSSGDSRPDLSFDKSASPERFSSESFRGRGETLCFHPCIEELTCFFLSPLLLLIISFGGSEPSDAFVFSWIQKLEEVTKVVTSGVEGIIRKLLLSDEIYATLARVASLGMNYGVERGLRMGHADVEFEAAIQKVSNFHVGAKALDDFPAAFEGSLSDVAQILPDKSVGSATFVVASPSSGNEAPEQVPR